MVFQKSIYHRRVCHPRANVCTPPWVSFPRMVTNNSFGNRWPDGEEHVTHTFLIGGYGWNPASCRNSVYWETLEWNPGPLMSHSGAEQVLNWRAGNLFTCEHLTLPCAAMNTGLSTYICVSCWTSFRGVSCFRLLVLTLRTVQTMHLSSEYGKWGYHSRIILDRVHII